MSTCPRSRRVRISAAGTTAALIAAAVVAASGVPAGARQVPAGTSGRAGSPRVVGFVEGHGERSMTDEFTAVVAALAPEFATRTVDLSHPAHALNDVAVLVVAGAPDVPDAELYQLDQFMMRGGGVLYLLDAADIPPGGLRSNISEGNIFSFLSAYGVTVNDDLVLDPACAPSASLGSLDARAPYPLWPAVGRQGLSSGHAITAGLDTLRFAWTSSITVLPDRDRSTEVLARSSGRSWTVGAYADLSPAQPFAPSGELAERALAGRGPGFVLATAHEGRFTSAFAGQKVIVQTEAGVEFIEPDGMLLTSVPARMVVFGSSLMFTDGLAEQLPGGADVVRRAVDWLAEGAKAARPSDEENGGKPPGIAAVISIVAACIAVLVGVVRSVRRAARRRRS